MADPGTPTGGSTGSTSAPRPAAADPRVGRLVHRRHPVPQGYEDAEPLFQRLMETVGLNMLASSPTPRSTG
jgi:hypothetical protein